MLRQRVDIKGFRSCRSKIEPAGISLCYMLRKRAPLEDVQSVQNGKTTTVLFDKRLGTGSGEHLT